MYEEYLNSFLVLQNLYSVSFCLDFNKVLVGLLEFRQSKDINVFVRIWVYVYVFVSILESGKRLCMEIIVF